MLVLCPKCKTKYRVDETKVGPEGAKIKCSKCQIIFRVMNRPAQAAPAQAPAAPKPAAPPVRPAPPPPPATAPAAPLQPKPPLAAPSATAAEAGITGPFMPKTAPKAELLLADADEVFLNKIGDELVAAGYAVWYAREGESAFNFIKEKKPPVAILEVMLPGLFGFEVCEKVKSDPDLAAATKLILIGSVYEKNRFRRAPISLYGADEYVDKYHDGVEVLAKVEKVLGFAPPPPPPPAEDITLESGAVPQPQPEVAPPAPVAPPPPRPVPVQPVPKPAVPRPVAPPVAPKPVAPPAPAAPPAAPKPVVQPAPAPKPAAAPPPPPKPVAPPPPKPAPVAPPVAPKPAAVPAPAPAPTPAGAAVSDWTKAVPDDQPHQKAARLARTIAADIALYNPELVERGVRDGNFYELLAKDIDDGRKHYLTKVSADIKSGSDYFKLALEDLIAKKKKKLGLA